MVSRVLLAVSDEPCAHAALHALESAIECPAGEAMVLGIFHPFRTIYAHKHPLIGRSIRHLLCEVNGAQADEVSRLVRETSARLQSFGWDVRSEVREGPVVDEVVRCCRNLRPHMLIIGTCSVNATARWRRAIWPEVVHEVACPVMVVKHHQESSEDLLHANGCGNASWQASEGGNSC